MSAGWSCDGAGAVGPRPNLRVTPRAGDAACRLGRGPTPARRLAILDTQPLENCPMSMIEIRIPDIGDFKDVPIIEVHVAPGATVAVEDPLLTLESDKATMEIPCPQAGTIGEVKVKAGDRVSEVDLIAMLEAEGAAAIPPKEKLREDAAPSAGNVQAGYGSPAGAYDTIEVKVPDIGDFKDVPVIEILVKEGDEISAEDPLMTLESDKATMEIPSPSSGTVAGFNIKVGDRVSQGDTIMTLRTQAAAKGNGAAMTMPPPTPATAPAGKPASAVAGDLHAEVLVLGAGPGGYTAAFRAADLGKQVVLTGGADRALAHPGRRLPERRLHPVESPAACG